jgi:hypothetical protein
MSTINLSDDELRFRVHREGDVVRFFGCIGDTPDLAALDGVLADKTVCDFSKLTFASWIGLASLGSYISGKKHYLTFQGVPFKIYDSMRMMKSFEEQEIRNAVLPLLDTKSGKVTFELTEFGPLRDAGMSGEDWVETMPGQILLVPARYLFPDLSGQRAGGPVPVKVSHPQKDVASFWLQYAAYCNSTVDISSVLVYAAKFNIMQILGEIKSKMASGEIALKLIDPKNSYTLVQRMESMMKAIEASFDTLAAKMQSQHDSSLKIYGDLTSKATLADIDGPGFTAAMAAYANSITAMTSVAAGCEDCGSSIGGQLGSLRATQVLRNGLATVTNPAPEMLTAIREAFAIMDIMSEDDWTATRVIIMDEIENIEGLIGRCIVTLQGFDMMRQILEHRIHEMEVLTEVFKNHGTDSLLDPDLREQVLGKIGAHMVTEQEKAAFEFFLPDGFARFAQTDRKEPGDVLLF